jgi:hypothetical protein
MVDGGQLTEEEAVRDGALTSDVADGSSSKVLLHLQRKAAVWFIGSDSDRGGLWWCSTVSRAVGLSVVAERGPRGRVSVRGENGGGLSTARGSAVSMIGSGWFSGAQRCECGHRSVIGSMAGSVSLVTRLGR